MRVHGATGGTKTKISVIARDSDLSRDNAGTRKAHWTSKSIRCPVRGQKITRCKKDYTVVWDKEGDLRRAASSNGWRAFLNYITTSSVHTKSRINKRNTTDFLYAQTRCSETDITMVLFFTIHVSPGLVPNKLNNF